MTTLNIAAYTQGLMAYPPNLAPNIKAIQSAGWDTIILGLLHIDDKGNVFFSSEEILHGGHYVGKSEWPEQLTELLTGQGSIIQNLLASVGGASTLDFTHISDIYRENHNSFDGTVLRANFQKFRETFRSVITIEMDVEDCYDQPSFVAFCRMLADMGFAITFCPYATWEMSFWTGSLQELDESHRGVVRWWDLQCYAGGDRNNPQEWADAIKAAIPHFDTTGFILVSDWSRFLDKPREDRSSWRWNGDCPTEMADKLSRLNGPSVGGAFVWTIGSILDYAKNQREKPDPQPCGNVGMGNYIQAIKDALS
jgi:hypothetical protein